MRKKIIKILIIVLVILVVLMFGQKTFATQNLNENEKEYEELKSKLNQGPLTIDEMEKLKELEEEKKEQIKGTDWGQILEYEDLKEKEINGTLTEEEAKRKEELTDVIEEKIDEVLEKGSDGEKNKYAEDISSLLTGINNGDFEIDLNMGTKTKDIVTKVLSYITTLGIIIGTVCVAISGFRYIMGSMAEKTEYKQAMPTLALGAGLLIVGSVIVKFILMVASKWQ